MAANDTVSFPAAHPSASHANAHQDEEYVSRDALTRGARGAAIVGGAGLFAASVQATLTKQNIGALGTFTRYGGTISTFAAIGFTYEFARNVAANLRQTDDLYNPAIGGFLAGGIAGGYRRSLAAILAHGSGASILAAAYFYQGSSLMGFGKDESVDEFERKQALREAVRRPIAETINQLGEGRGIHAPGYAERRRERIKQNLGIDVGENASAPSQARGSGS